MNKSAYLRNIFVLVFIVLASVCEGQNPQWRVYNTGNSGLPGNAVANIAIDRKNNNIKWIGVPYHGLVKFDGINWTVFDTSNSPLTLYSPSCITIDKYNNLWMGGTPGALFKFDGKNNWTIYNTTNSGLPSNFVQSIEIDENNVKWIGTGNGLVKFNDTSWVIYNTTNSGIPSNDVMCIEIENGFKWTGTYNSGLARYNDTNWIIYQTGNSGIPSDYIWTISIDSLKNKWIGTDFGGVGKFNSELNTWGVFNTANSGIPGNFIRGFGIDLKNIKWIGTSDFGLGRYNDSSWITYNQSNSPLPAGSVYGVTVDSYNNKWFGCSGGLAIYNENGIVGIQQLNNSLPKNFILYQNFPNPFNPSTTISYSLPRSGLIRITVFDITGKEVEKLADEFKHAGSYDVEFTADNLSSGIYFYKFEAEDFKETKRMILLK